MLSEVSISARGYDPLLFARAFNLHAKTETMTVLLCAFRCRTSSSVCQAVGIQGSLESGASARAIFVTREHKSANLTCITSVCAKSLICNDRKEVCVIISFLNSNQAIFSSKSSLPTFRPQCCGLLQGTSSTDWEYTINTENCMLMTRNESH